MERKKEKSKISIFTRIFMMLFLNVILVNSSLNVGVDNKITASQRVINKLNFKNTKKQDIVKCIDQFKKYDRKIIKESKNIVAQLKPFSSKRIEDLGLYLDNLKYNFFRKNKLNGENLREIKNNNCNYNGKIYNNNKTNINKKNIKKIKQRNSNLKSINNKVDSENLEISWCSSLNKSYESKEENRIEEKDSNSLEYSNSNLDLDLKDLKNANFKNISEKTDEQLNEILASNSDSDLKNYKNENFFEEINEKIDELKTDSNLNSELKFCEIEKICEKISEKIEEFTGSNLNSGLKNYKNENFEEFCKDYNKKIDEFTDLNFNSKLKKKNDFEEFCKITNKQLNEIIDSNKDLELKEYFLTIYDKFF